MALVYYNALNNVPTQFELPSKYFSYIHIGNYDDKNPSYPI